MYNRRYRPHRRNSSYSIPLAAVSIIAVAILLWFIVAKGEAVVNFFKGETVIKYDNSEANDNLSHLLKDLSGDRARLLDLAANSKIRLAWIKDESTRLQFRWFLMERLLSNDLWDDAVLILPEVEDLATPRSLERLAIAALAHEEYELQLRLDRKLQDLAVNRPADTDLLLRSIRRTAETCIRMHEPEEAVKAIARLEAKDVLMRVSSAPFAAEAADLQMLRADVSMVKEYALQQVRNILEAANWPPCMATSRLMLEEVSSVLRDNPTMNQAALKEIENKLMRCRDALLDYADREHKLPQCYLTLGELRLRMGNYEGCAQALTLANAFAEGYGQSNLDWQLQVARLRSRANILRGAKVEAMEDCRFLSEHEKSPEGLMQALTFLSANSTGQEREKVLARLWSVMQAQPKTTKAEKEERARIANEIFQLNIENGSREQALKWGQEAMKAAQDAYPDLSDGKALRASLALALQLRKKESGDVQALRRLRDIVQMIERMEEPQRKKLDETDKKLYADAVRELARTYLLMGDSKLARTVVNKIHERLPDRRR
ncbi:MAG: hypothetical protein J1E42_02985 [Akkermansiaceae bacterium]|nr:hypothetical protein [Akkermansiaceae bacterium]